jgi:hypothetical protein
MGRSEIHVHRETFMERRLLAALPEVPTPRIFRTRRLFKVTRRRGGRALAPREERKSGPGNHEQPPPLFQIEADRSIKRWLNASKIA